MNNKQKAIDIEIGTSWFLWYKWNDFYIYDSIDSKMFENIIVPFKEECKAQLKTNNPTINIYINSDGWVVSNWLEFVECIEEAKAHWITINTYVYAWAASMATILFIIWTNRYVGNNASMLIHYPMWWDRKENVVQSENNSKAYQNTVKIFKNMYEKYCAIENLDDKLAEWNHYIFGGKNLKKQWLADFII